MRILPYLSSCCSVLAARFSNLTKFECSHRRDTVTYTHDIFHNKCKDLIMQHEKFQIYTLKINTIIWHCKKNSDYFWTRVYKSRKSRLLWVAIFVTSPPCVDITPQMLHTVGILRHHCIYGEESEISFTIGDAVMLQEPLSLHDLTQLEHSRKHFDQTYRNCLSLRCTWIYGKVAQ